MKYFTLPIRLVLHFLGFVTGEGSWRLSEFERKAVELAASTMTKENQVILQGQLKGWYYVQRLHAKRMNDLYPYFPQNWPKMALPEQYCVATLSLKSSAGNSKITVEAFRGLIRAVRCKKSPIEIIKHTYTLEIISGGEMATDEIAPEIDMLEHPGPPYL